MKILPMADGRWPINGSFAGRRLARGRPDGNQGIGFFEQGGFVGFFFDRADFGDEFRPAPRAARRTIIRGHRGSAANDLFGNDPAGIVIFGNSTGQFDNPQRKSFGAGFQFNWVHNLKLQIQSAIGNRQSAITR